VYVSVCVCVYVCMYTWVEMPEAVLSLLRGEWVYLKNFSLTTEHHSYVY